MYYVLLGLTFIAVLLAIGSIILSVMFTSIITVTGCVLTCALAIINMSMCYLVKIT